MDGDEWRMGKAYAEMQHCAALYLWIHDFLGTICLVIVEECLRHAVIPVIRLIARLPSGLRPFRFGTI